MSRREETSASVLQQPSASPGSRRGSRTGRVLLVLYFCAGIAGLAWLGGDQQRSAQALRERDPMTGYYPPQMPRYPGAREVPAGRKIVVGRTPARMSYFVTADDPGKVADFYAGFWRERGLWVRSDVTHRGGTVSAVDGAHQQVLQVLLIARRRSTLVLPSVTSAPLRGNTDGQDEGPVPLFPGSRVLLQTSADAGADRARVILSVNDGTLDENLAHYRAALARAGYREDPDQRALKARPGEQLNVRTLVGHNAAGGEMTLTLAAQAGRRGGHRQQTRVHLMVVGP